MKTITQILLIFVLLGGTLNAQFNLENTQSDGAVRLERFSFARVNAARQMYARRMRKTKLATTAVVGSLAAMVAGGIGYKIYTSRQKNKQEKLKQRLGKIEKMAVHNGLLDGTTELTDQILFQNQNWAKGLKESMFPNKYEPTTVQGWFARIAKLEKPDPSCVIQTAQFDAKKTTQAKQVYSALQSDYKNRVEEIKSNINAIKDETNSVEKLDEKGWSLGDKIIWAPVMFGMAVGVAGLVFTTGQHVLRVISGTLEETLNLWARGYTYWYNALAERVQASFNNLRESLIQARKISQNNYDPGVLTRHVQRLSSGAVVSTHYRADIITMYQVGLGMLERLTAVMYLRAPEEQHAALHNQTIKLSHKINSFADCLERDLNERTQGFLTHYQEETLEKYHQAFEEVQIILATNGTTFAVR